MNNTNKSSSPIIWIVLVLGLIVGFWSALKKGPETQEEPINQTTEVYDGAGFETPKNNSYQAQYSEDNPKLESVDPFYPHADFEVVLKSTKNPNDFDFHFNKQKTTPTYNLENGEIELDLSGTAFSKTQFEKHTGLSVEICINDQISFQKRKTVQILDLPYVKETTERDENNKWLYSFDFKEKIKLEPGLHYFIITPTGRNRVMHGGKFLVR